MSSVKVRTNVDLANPFDFESQPQPLRLFQDVSQLKLIIWNFQSRFLMVWSKQLRCSTCMKAASIQAEMRRWPGLSTLQGLLSPASSGLTNLRERSPCYLRYKTYPVKLTKIIKNIKKARQTGGQEKFRLHTKLCQRVPFFKIYAQNIFLDRMLWIKIANAVQCHS